MKGLSLPNYNQDDADDGVAPTAGVSAVSAETEELMVSGEIDGEARESRRASIAASELASRRPSCDAALAILRVNAEMAIENIEVVTTDYKTDPHFLDLLNTRKCKLAPLSPSECRRQEHLHRQLEDEHLFLGVPDVVGSCAPDP